MKQNKLLIIYCLLLIVFSLYSYSLVDPNLTLLNHPAWTTFREQAVQLGYHNRNLSSMIYLTLTASLFLFHLFFYKNYKKFSAIKIAFVCGFILLLSYPLLSHDLFNYMFDARILTYHHANPYASRALDFPSDPWIRFMHWTHRTYPYGPSWLILSIIPSFLAFGKFILNFLFFKLMFVLFYIVSVYYLNKIDKKQSIFYATHPLILIEGLINAHNDFIATALAIFGIYLVLKNQKKLLARIFLLLSGGVKYITMPVIFAVKDRKSLWNLLVAAGIIILTGYLSIFSEIQPWYYLSLFVFLPFYLKYIQKFQIFFFGLLLSYYPYIAYDGWAQKSNVNLKHDIIIFFAVLNLAVLTTSYLKSRLLERTHRN